MNYEKPQKGNPHQLTVKQHCFPASCIKRFIGNDGKVQLFKLPQSETTLAKPDAQIFCAKRAWDQKAESIFMKNIEDNYKVIAEEIISNDNVKLGVNQNSIVTDMFALWNIRMHWMGQPVSNQVIEGAIDVAVKFTIDEQEELEKHGITAIRPNLTIPGRSLTANSIQSNLIAVRDQLRGAQWGILKSTGGEFIVPDQTPNSRVLPLTPNLCLRLDSPSNEIGELELAKINACSIAGSKAYYFARDLSKCPR